jgi:hypothetical protein
MTDEELNAIETRANAAQPAPWTPLKVKSDEYSILDADCEFIAHAREDVPALVAEVRQLQATIKYLRRFAS